MGATSLNNKIQNALRIDRALLFVWQASPFYTICSAVIIIICGVLPILTIYLTKQIIDSVTLLMGETNTGSFGSEYRLIFWYIGLAAGVSIVGALFNFLSDYTQKAQTLKVSDYMFEIIHQKAVLADLSLFESPSYQNTLFRAQREGPYRPVSIINGLFSAGQSLTSFMAAAWLLFLFHPVLPIILILAVIPGILIRLSYSNKIYAWQERRTEDERRAYYYHWMLTDDKHAKEFRLFNIGKHFMAQFQNTRETLRTEKLWFEKRRASGDFIAQTCGVCAVFSSLTWVAISAVRGDITIGSLVMFFQAFQKGLNFLKIFFQSCAQMYEDNLFLSYLYNLLQITPQITAPENPISVPDKIQSGIKLKNVNFFYQNTEKYVLNCVNFSIPTGKIVALVGENGSGKSTLVKLITRLYDPSEGCICLDGIDIKNFKPDQYRKKISVVFQDHLHYQLSAAENIYLGNTAFQADASKIQNAARKTDIHKKISSFSAGYETILGKWFQHGEELSLGEWQMLAISRAFFRDAEIVVLDEPSSALDPQMEQRIFSQLRTLVKEKAALIITHRFSSAKLADNILVLENGSIMEEGSHDDLIRRNGTYARLYRTQANGYR